MGVLTLMLQGCWHGTLRWDDGLRCNRTSKPVTSWSTQTAHSKVPTYVTATGGAPGGSERSTCGSTRTAPCPSDNPFGNAVWSYGHRNPQGLVFDSHGPLWEQEFGNSVMDETNLITKGGNYGWPACEGTSGTCGTAGFIAPKATYSTAAASCSTWSGRTRLPGKACPRPRMTRQQRRSRIAIQGKTFRIAQHVSP